MHQNPVTFASCTSVNESGGAAVPSAASRVWGSDVIGVVYTVALALLARKTPSYVDGGFKRSENRETGTEEANLLIFYD